MLPLIAVFIVVAWLCLLGVTHVSGRYRHTRKSKAAALALVPAAFGVARWLAPRIFPQLLDSPYFIWWALALTFPIYVMLLVALAEAWRLSKQRVFDEAIAGLEARQEEIRIKLAEVRRTRRERELELRERKERESRGKSSAEELQREVDEWASVPELARIRALRVEEWRNEARGLSPEELAAEMRALEQEIDGLKGSVKEADLDKRDQLKIKLLIMKQEAIGRQLSQVTPTEGASSPGAGGGRETEAPAYELEESRLLREAEEIERQLGVWQRRKKEFLDGKVILD